MWLAVEESQANVIIIDDVRFEDEANFISELDGDIVMIKRPGGPTLPWHASENPPEDLSTILMINNQTVESFEIAVANLFSQIYPNLFQ